jgi:hypothetical protein
MKTMKVNIKGVWYNSEVEPILIKLTDEDKKNISNMNASAMNYVSFPLNIEFETVKEMLKLDETNNKINNIR